MRATNRWPVERPYVLEDVTPAKKDLPAKGPSQSLALKLLLIAKPFRRFLIGLVPGFDTTYSVSGAALDRIITRSVFAAACWMPFALSRLLDRGCTASTSSTRSDGLAADE